MIRAAIYARATNETALQSQVQMLKKLARDKKYSMSKKDIFTDIGPSTKYVYKSPGLRRFFNLQHSRDVKKLLVASPDRISRSPDIAYTAGFLLSLRGIEIEYVNVNARRKR